ncbi:dehydrogenase [Auriscalpium vulgare]|uniref:Dehydrogenase n=1 Tax=Auriscalpium vulgare TaxID=40419 RepID=A0ACB8S5Q2_9AGAM|nr:dehydrogenase [Auriscalpium vulgare]
MAPVTQLAATITADGSIAVKQVAVPKPGTGEVLVKVVAGAQNPTDWKTAAKLAPREGVNIAGNDFAGVVEEIGPDVPDGLRTVGERVAGFVRGNLGPNGAFSEYVLASAQYAIAHVPDSWSLEDAAQLGIAPYTAIQTLYQSHNFPLPGASAAGTPLLVLGGSSSVGQWVVQFARLSGLYVIATASAKNLELVKSLGADEVYDYHDADVTQKIAKAAAAKGGVRHVVDTISEGSTPKLAFDVLGEEGGVIAAILPYPAPPPKESIKVINSAAFTLLGKDFDFPFNHVSTPDVKERVRGYVKVLESIIASGKVKPNPTLVFPKGLASVADGFEFMKAGKVSAQKITYRISDTPSA